MIPWMFPDKTHRFLKSVASALRVRCGVGQGQRMLVATSGGGDSVALLRALSMLDRQWQLKLAVGHVQHHLRDGSLSGLSCSEADARFVESLASGLGLPFFRADLDLAESDGPARYRGNLEARAREYRYQALAAMAREFEAYWVATAHHADDQVETLLMRLLRGASVKGLRSIAWRRPLTEGQIDCGDSPRSSGRVGVEDGELGAEDWNLVRPMLGVTRSEAHDFLRSLGQSWREDHTNADQCRLRNRLRSEVLPLLKAIRPDLPSKVISVTDHLRDASSLIDAEVDRCYESIVRNRDVVSLDRSEARGMNRAVLVGLIRRLLHDAGVPLDRLGLRLLNPIVRAIYDKDGRHRVFDLAGAVLMVSRSSIKVRESRAPE